MATLCVCFFVIKSFIILLTDVLYDANNQLTANIHIKWLASTASYKMEQIFTVNMVLVLQQNRLRWYGHVWRKDDDDWVKKCMEHEVEGSRPRVRPEKTWKEVVREDCQARKLNKEDAMDRCKWRKMTKEAR